MSSENFTLNLPDSGDLSIETILELLDRCTSASEEERVQAHLLLPDMTSQERQEYYKMLCEAARADGIHILPVKE